jgi:N-ethylmaleimide reductase
MNNSLFEKYKLNEKLQLKNRIIMAPMTRCKAIKNLIPNPAMGQYYARRADAGLIITEGTIISADGQGYPNTPGIFTADQINGWKYITDEVHTADGKIFLQLWHVGRASHPMYLNGALPVAPSAIGLKGRMSYTNFFYETPRALALKEIPKYIEYYANAALNAIEANFDGVEIHGANGYLIDQFLHHSTNIRTDDYGVTPEGMSRFLLEIIDAIATVIDKKRVGIRLSPGAYVLEIERDRRDAQVFEFLLKEIEKRQIAYIHTAIEHDINIVFDYLGGKVSSFVRKNYYGNLIACGSYNPILAANAIENNEFDLIAFARLFLANPDLIKKIKAGEALFTYHNDLLKEVN